MANCLFAPPDSSEISVSTRFRSGSEHFTMFLRPDFSLEDIQTPCLIEMLKVIFPGRLRSPRGPGHRPPLRIPC
ncbi:hypothetical protein J7T55_009172 [Diaporthe amygdali]|uniref:uncharacterized protein n=1 Tax=Phomopsis amygdali TaxID=1214568 RepID=UPI0022FF1F5E|nr:uncharacterized protein J7T55_009172 [Diaporthe amygdali]KAJ0118389.1 hypothetical protein J7T55_009172 [Diaporthe amygdali]